MAVGNIMKSFSGNISSRKSGYVKASLKSGIISNDGQQTRLSQRMARGGCETWRERRRANVALSSLSSSPEPVSATTTIGKLPEALLFDCDGVLVDTERDGHRVSFNLTFQDEFGSDTAHVWDVDLYGELLKTGGGKERMMKYFLSKEGEEPFKSMKTEEDRKEFLKKMHLKKTDTFMDMVASGKLPLRPGVKALVQEAIKNGVKVAVCSTSNEKAVSAIVENMLGKDIADVMPVYAGDMVPRKKPDPAIYTMAAEKLGVNPENCVVVEDSHIGLSAAKAAGMRCVVTMSPYTEDEDFAAADAIFPCIGEGDEQNFSVVKDLTFPGPLFKE